MSILTVTPFVSPIVILMEMDTSKSPPCKFLLLCPSLDFVRILRTISNFTDGDIYVFQIYDFKKDWIGNYKF